MGNVERRRAPAREPSQGRESGRRKQPNKLQGERHAEGGGEKGEKMVGGRERRRRGERRGGEGSAPRAKKGGKRKTRKRRCSAMKRRACDRVCGRVCGGARQGVGVLRRWGRGASPRRRRWRRSDGQRASAGTTAQEVRCQGFDGSCGVARHNGRAGSTPEGSTEAHGIGARKTTHSLPNDGVEIS